MKLKHICIVAENYPSKDNPAFPFVQQLAYSLSNEGVECTVIAPQSITAAIIHKRKLLPTEAVDKNPEGKKIRVLRPAYITFSDTKLDILQRVAYGSMRKAIKNCLDKIGKIDCLYCYFWHIGLTVSQAIGKSEIPLFVQASECWLTVKDFMMKPQFINKVRGVVCASGKNKEESISGGLTTEEKTVVIVNGYRPDEFYVMDKKKCRADLEIPENTFVVAFVGGFIERKGIKELCEAVNRFDDVYTIFIGAGDCQPTCKNVLFSGKVQHNMIGKYLNAADIFVLPTKAEGCCNAIIEATACGLPVVSSNKSFNDEILNDRCSLRIDEASIEDIYQAIKYLKENPAKRETMSNEALKKAESLTIDHRAKAIKDYIERQCEK